MSVANINIKQIIDQNIFMHTVKVFLVVDTNCRGCYKIL